eukprot:g17695.t1
MECKVSFAVPGPAGYFFTGAIFQWKGKEPFAGDQMQTLLENGRFSKQFLRGLKGLLLDRPLHFFGPFEKHPRGRHRPAVWRHRGPGFLKRSRWVA